MQIGVTEDADKGNSFTGGMKCPCGSQLWHSSGYLREDKQGYQAKTKGENLRSRGSN